MLSAAISSGNSSFFSLDSAVALGSALLNHIKRFNAHNQVDEFTDRQVLVQRILATSSSCGSITACLIGMYAFLAIDPRRLIFRHQLIFFLLSFDLLKAVILLLYPTRVLSHSSAYYNDHFCQVVGFFTATAIEGADIAILAFAVHTYLLIFKPGFNTKVKNSTRTEGGLYKFRYYVYGLSFLIPLVLASLAFIRHSGVSGYTSLVCWCYLPERPVWYRLVLSWVPRWTIIVIIFTIYGLIYFHVIREFKTLGGVFTTFHKTNNHTLYPKPSQNDKPSFYSAFKYFLDRVIPKWIIPEQQDLAAMKTNQTTTGEHHDSGVTLFAGQNNPHKEEVDPDDMDDSDLSSSPVHVDTENIIYDPEMHAANLEKFRKRQRIIEKQMKSIFIYPFAYCFIWLFPFMLYVTQINYEEEHHPVFWLNCMGAFMQPFNGFVDTLVFFYREQPWKYTIMKNFEKEHMTKMDNLIHQGFNNHGSYGHRDHDGESIATSARFTKQSLSASTGLIDIKEYPMWRQWLSALDLPLFHLPSEESVAKFQVEYIDKKLKSTSHEDQQQGNFGAGIRIVPPTHNNSIINGHDFSAVLGGDLNETNFRSNLEKFSLDFNGKHPAQTQSQESNSYLNTRRSVNAGSSRKNSIISSNKSTRSRQFSAPEIPDPVLVEGRKTSYTNTNVALELKPLKRPTNSVSTPRKSGGISRTSLSSSNAAADDDMDFLEFLRKGPS